MGRSYWRGDHYDDDDIDDDGGDDDYDYVNDDVGEGGQEGLT